jgi:chemotaxis protein methyltransferase CheR
MNLVDAGPRSSMTEAERLRISTFIEKEFGIKMPANKKSLLEGRLAKRLVACGLSTYTAYFDLISTSPAGDEEFLHFEDLVSTHETSFFREITHFDYLATKVLPALVRSGQGERLEVLSAACSTGEEAYTLAMVIDSTVQGLSGRNREFRVEGVDLSSHAVAIAQRGVYHRERTRTIPEEWRNQYLMTSKDKSKGLCRFIPELRQSMSFHTGNFLGNLNLVQRSYDLVFCRNVLIYFDPGNQKRVIRLLLDRLKPEGLLFLGHSETMLSMGLPVKSVYHGVYQKS